MDVVEMGNGAIFLRKYVLSTPVNPEPDTIYYFDMQKKRLISEKYIEIRKNILKTQYSYVVMNDNRDKAVIITYRGTRPTISGHKVSDFINTRARYFITERPIPVTDSSPNIAYSLPEMYLRGEVEPLSATSYLINGTLKITTENLKSKHVDYVVQNIRDKLVPSQEMSKGYMLYHDKFSGDYIITLEFAKSPLDPPISIKEIYRAIDLIPHASTIDYIMLSAVYPIDSGKILQTAINGFIPPELPTSAKYYGDIHGTVTTNNSNTVSFLTDTFYAVMHKSSNYSIISSSSVVGLFSEDFTKAVVARKENFQKVYRKAKELLQKFYTHYGIVTENYAVLFDAKIHNKSVPLLFIEGGEIDAFFVPYHEGIYSIKGTYEDIAAQNVPDEKVTYEYYRFKEPIKFTRGVTKINGSDYNRSVSLYLNVYGVEVTGILYFGDDDDFPYSKPYKVDVNENNLSKVKDVLYEFHQL